MKNKEFKHQASLLQGKVERIISQIMEQTKITNSGILESMGSHQFCNEGICINLDDETIQINQWDSKQYYKKVAIKCFELGIRNNPYDSMLQISYQSKIKQICQLNWIEWTRLLRKHEASKGFDHGIDINPNNSELYIKKAYLLEWIGRNDEFIQVRDLSKQYLM